MRSDGDRFLEAIDEALEIGRIGDTPVHIFHLKAAGRQNWEKMQLAIARINAARIDGRQVTADIYPYIDNGLGIDALIHLWHFGGGRLKLLSQSSSNAQLRTEVRNEIESTEGWENWFRHTGYDRSRVIVGQSNEPKYRELSGQSVTAIVKACDEDVWDTFFNQGIRCSFKIAVTKQVITTSVVHAGLTVLIHLDHSLRSRPPELARGRWNPQRMVAPGYGVSAAMNRITTATPSSAVHGSRPVRI